MQTELIWEEYKDHKNTQYNGCGYVVWLDTFEVQVEFPGEDFMIPIGVHPNYEQEILDGTIKQKVVTRILRQYEFRIEQLQGAMEEVKKV